MRNPWSLESKINTRLHSYDDANIQLHNLTQVWRWDQQRPTGGLRKCITANGHSLNTSVNGTAVEHCRVLDGRGGAFITPGVAGHCDFLWLGGVDCSNESAVMPQIWIPTGEAQIYD